MTNKKTEALKLAGLVEASIEECIGDDGMVAVIPLDLYNDLMTAIREALAEPEITTPDVCGEVCARAKLCYGCNKAFDEALADHVEQSLTMVADHSGDANEMVYSKPSVFDGVCCGCSKKAVDGYALYCIECWEKSNGDPFAASGKLITEQDHIANAGKMVGCAYCDNPLFAGTKCNNCGRVTLAEPVKQEPVCIDWDTKTDKPIMGYVAPVQPVKQEPVAWAYIDADGSFMDALDRQHGAYQTPLYAAPAQPVKQEPVAYLVTGPYEKHAFADLGSAEAYCRGLNKGFGEDSYIVSPLYAAPVDAKAIGLAIHYPACWDTAAYPTLDSALAEVAASGKPFRCTNDDCVDAKAIRAEALEEAE